MVSQGVDVMVKVDFGQVGGLVKLFVDAGHRLYAVLGFLEQDGGVGMGGLAGLHSQEAGDNLQVVFDPMMQFFEQDIFFAEGAGELVLGLDLFGELGLDLLIEVGLLDGDRDLVSNLYQ